MHEFGKNEDYYPPCETVKIEDCSISTQKLDNKTRINLESIAIKMALNKSNKLLKEKGYDSLNVVKLEYIGFDYDNQIEVPIPYYKIVYDNKKWLVPTSRLPVSGLVQTKMEDLISVITSVLIGDKKVEDIDVNKVFDITINNSPDSLKKSEEQGGEALSLLKEFIKSIKEDTVFEGDDFLMLIKDT